MVRPQAHERLEVLQGTIERITFQNPDTHFTVARLSPEGGRGTVTVVGSLTGVQEGEWLRCEGVYEDDRTYGRQLRVRAFEASTPSTALGIQRYLGAGLVKGVGEELAKRIVGRFGAKTLEVLETEPERLLEVEGIGKKRQELLARAWSEHRAARRVLVFLRGHGVGAAQAARIVKAYGDESVEKVSRNPYRLATEIWGIGFLTADRIGRSIGIAADAPQRADAGVRHVLQQGCDAGNVCLRRADAVERAAEALGLDAALVEAAVERLVESGAVVVEPARPGGAPAALDEPEVGASAWLYLRPLYLAEATLAAGLARLLRARSALPPILIDRAVAWVEARRGIALAESQRAALRLALGAKVCAITGGPGVGKTTIVASLLDIVEAKRVRVRLAAPTGRAAKRLEQSCGREAQTLHRLLKWSPRAGDFEHCAARPLPDCDLLVLDEASMIDLPLMHRVVAALPDAAHLVIVGDGDQLPSVGPGNVLTDIIRSGAVPVARLTEVHRQAAGSTIVLAAHRINGGEVPELPSLDGPGDLHFVEVDAPERALEVVKRLVCHELPRRLGVDPVRDVQVLAPMHRGTVGVQALNRELQAALGSGAGPAIVRHGTRFEVGAKVLQVRNNYDLEAFNGDVGVVCAVDEADGELRVRFEDGREVAYGGADLDELELAYAVSIHKSQGSEYPCVVVPLLTQHYILLQRNLLYTAVTRARRFGVLVGQRRALWLAARNDRTSERGSLLAERLRDCLEGRDVIEGQ